MTLPMNIRVALRSAKVGFVFARRGLVMEACSSYFLPRLIGYSKALHLNTTGATYRADDRLLDGLFTEFGDTPEEVMRKAIAIAEDVAKNTSIVGTYLMKELIWRDAGSAEGQHLLDSRVLYELFSSQYVRVSFGWSLVTNSSRDNKEGVQSFLEKRPPQFVGSMGNDAPAVYPWWTPVDVKGKVKGNPDAVKSKL